MALTDIIKEIQKLNTADQLRLKEFFTKSLAAFSASKPILKRCPNRNIKTATCTHCHSNNVVRFGKYSVKVGMKTMERQRYRCKDCGKTFTMSRIPLCGVRTFLTNGWILFSV